MEDVSYIKHDVYISWCTRGNEKDVVVCARWGTDVSCKEVMKRTWFRCGGQL